MLKVWAKSQKITIAMGSIATLMMAASMTPIMPSFLSKNATADDSVRFIYTAMGQVRDLKAYTAAQLEKMKPAWVNEKDSISGKSGRWRGHAIHLLVEDVLKLLPLEDGAKVDLLVIRGKNGTESLIPRAFTIRHPYYLIFGSPKAPLPDTMGPFFSLLPFKSLQIGREKDGLPTQRFLIHQLDRVELANVKDRFGILSLKRRTDPVAVRGEKIFLNSCLTCHGVGGADAGNTFAARILKAEGLAEKQNHSDRVLASQQVVQNHPQVNDFPKLQDTETKAIGSYLRAYLQESDSAK